MFLEKKTLLAESDKAKEKISVNRIGLVAWKYHSFLKPEQNTELQKLMFYNIQQGLNDNIGSVQDSLVVRSTMSDLDYEDDYVFNKKVDNDRKTHIIYGFGSLDGTNPKTVTVNGNISDVGKPDGYFHFFNPFIVLRRNENAEFIFDKPGNYKIYGMTCEALGLNVCG